MPITQPNNLEISINTKLINPVMIKDIKKAGQPLHILGLGIIENNTFQKIVIVCKTASKFVTSSINPF